jgi:inorganic pyrophosphatase
VARHRPGAALPSSPLIGDPTYGDVDDVAQLPRTVVDRLRHYFLTYKVIPGDAPPIITVDPVYGPAPAHAVLEASRRDYDARFPRDA